MSQYTEKFDLLMSNDVLDFVIVIRKERNPLPTDDYSIGIEEGTKFVNKITKETFTCVNNTVGIAEWVSNSGSSGGLPSGNHGDLFFRDTPTVVNALPIGMPNQVLTSNGIDVEWRFPSTGISRETRVLITNTMNTGTNISVTSSGPDYVVSGSVGNLLSSQTLFRNSLLQKVYLNGMLLDKELDVLWVNSQTFSLINNIIDDGDELKIFG